MAIAVISFLFVASLFAGSLPISIGSSNTPPTDIGEVFPEQPYSPHVDPGETHPPYNTVPATSGWHVGAPAGPTQWGVYDRFIDDEILVHNLEHGGVGIHYDCPEGCPELVAQLSAIAQRAPKVVMSPYPGMETRIALTAWRVLDRLDVFDEARVTVFVDAHMGSQRAPEYFAQ